MYFFNPAGVINWWTEVWMQTQQNVSEDKTE